MLNIYKFLLETFKLHIPFLKCSPEGEKLSSLFQKESQRFNKFYN
jgi:hypothetical protein